MRDKIFMKKLLIVASGHKNITAKHKTTIGITKDVEISKRADCIIAVNADKAPLEFPNEFKSLLKDDNAIVKIKIKVEDLEDIVIGKGSSKLILTHPKEIVIRKSDFICEKTLCIKANKAACDLDKGLIKKLQEGCKVLIEISVERRN